MPDTAPSEAPPPQARPPSDGAPAGSPSAGSATDGASPSDSRALSEAALARYARREKPRRIAYVAAVVVALLALGVVVKIAYVHGEISHATLHPIPASDIPQSIAPRAAGATLTTAWKSGDRAALGQPLYDGTVVTYDQHTMRGRDALTGKQTWSYTRTDRDICAAAQLNGTAVAIFELHGNCDQLTAVSSESGDRRWERTLDKDSNQFDKSVRGRPHFIVAPTTLIVWTSAVIYAINPDGDQDTGNKNAGIDRWVFTHAGCSIENVTLGLTGALISQTCSGQQCDDPKICANGPQLLLRDALKSDDSNSKTNQGNPDQITWLKAGVDLIPAAADQVTAAVTSDGTSLRLFDHDKGKVTGRLPLDGGRGAVTSAWLNDADLITFGGVTYAVSKSGALKWQAETGVVPTATAAAGVGVPTLAEARLNVVSDGAIATLDPSDGKISRRSTAPSPLPSGATVYPLGAGYLVAGPSSTQVLQ